MTKVLIGLAISFLLLLPNANSILAQSNNAFVSIVNPIRIAPYTQDAVASLKTQYETVSSLEVPATWLLTYDVLQSEEMVNEIVQFNDDQEIGIWMEIGEMLADTTSIEIPNEPWHHSDRVFLSGYTQEQRIHIIDEIFAVFKQRFGAYPTTVGSWWTDAYSLSYMQETYGVSANVTVADQFSTDNYQLWGQYWSTPFYPSKYHIGVPAGQLENKLNVVNLQWAPRDPIHGYYDSLYSTQDYHHPEVNLDISYLKSWSIYMPNHTKTSLDILLLA